MDPGTGAPAKKIGKIEIVVPVSSGSMVGKAAQFFINKQNPDGTIERSPLKMIFLSPWLYTALLAAAFCITFGMVFVSSGVDLNSLDQTNLKVWWAGTLLSSALFLLLFYLVFGSSEYLNKYLILLLFSTLVIVQVSMLLSQINLRVK